MTKPFDRVHSGYDKFMKFWGLYKEDTILDMLELGGDEIVVDIGGGTGHVAEHLSEHCRKIFVLDESQKMLSHVADRKNIETIHGDALNSTFDNNSIDVVVMTDVMHHIENQTKLIREMHRILKSEGKIVIYDFNKAHVWTKLLSLMESILFGKLHYKTLNYFIDLLRSNDFSIETILDRGFYFIMLGAKPSRHETP